MISYKKINYSRIKNYTFFVFKNNKLYKKIPVVECDLHDGMYGGYDQTNNILYLSPLLNKIPKLKKIIIEHEIGHSFDNNIAQAIYRDLKDYPKLYLTKEQIQLRKKEIEKMGGKIEYFIALLQKNTYKILMNFLFIPACWTYIIIKKIIGVDINGNFRKK